MKTAVASTELESLRAEVRRLQSEVDDLRSQLDSSEETDEVWNVWPYTWISAAYEASQDWVHDAEDRLSRWSMDRNNRRSCSH